MEEKETIFKMCTHKQKHIKGYMDWTVNSESVWYMALIIFFKYYKSQNKQTDHLPQTLNFLCLNLCNFNISNFDYLI